MAKKLSVRIGEPGRPATGSSADVRPLAEVCSFADVRSQLDRVVGGVQAVLGENLSGIYLHGSLAMGCFNRARSDIDLLVVTGRPLFAPEKRALAELLLVCSGAPSAGPSPPGVLAPAPPAPGAGPGPGPDGPGGADSGVPDLGVTGAPGPAAFHPLEVSFLNKASLHPWRHPAPFDLHYGESHREEFTAVLAGENWADWLMRERTDRDLAAHITVTLTRGVCLAGAPAAQTFPPVPRADYADALWYDVQGAPEAIAHNPVYLTLNLTRVLCFLREGRICSKAEGAEWGLRALPNEHRPPVALALACYRGAGPDAAFDAAALRRYASYMDGEIRALMGLAGGAGGR